MPSSTVSHNPRTESGSYENLRTHKRQPKINSQSELCESEVLLAATPHPDRVGSSTAALVLSTQHMPSVLHLWYDTVSAAWSPQLRSKATDYYELQCI